jgi:hypothetical protein
MKNLRRSIIIIAASVLMMPLLFGQISVRKAAVLINKKSTATVLNGTSQYWQKTASNFINLGNDDWTINFVVNPSSYQGSAGSAIVDMASNGVATNPRILTSVTSTGRIYVNIRDTLATRQDSTSANSIPLNKWTYVCISSTDSVRVYINGVRDFDCLIIKTPLPRLLSGIDTLSIGYKSVYTSTQAYLNGKVGLVNLISGVGLLQSDISAINTSWKSSGFPVMYSGGTVILSYDWRSGGYDKSGNNNHLTNVGGAVIIKGN